MERSGRPAEIHPCGGRRAPGFGGNLGLLSAQHRNASGGHGVALMRAAGRRTSGPVRGKAASPVTIGGSIALIVIGAILRWGITWKPTHVNLEAIGVILMAAGVAGLIISIVFIAMRRRQRAPAAEVYEERRYTEPPT